MIEHEFQERGGEDRLKKYKGTVNTWPNRRQCVGVLERAPTRESQVPRLAAHPSPTPLQRVGEYTHYIIHQPLVATRYLILITLKATNF